MENNDRKSRQFIFTQMTLEMALFNKYNTYGDFWDDFAARMKKETGECSEADMDWCKERLEWYIRRNNEPEKVDRRRRENRGKKEG